MRLSAGARLGPYEIIASLGAGGMGEVYRARDTKLDRDVAIKILPDAFASDPERVVRFQREAKTLASLNHPNIGHIYGLEQEGDVRAIVLELIEGPTLADRIARGPMPATEVIRIAKQIVDAVEAAHEKGVIHRDLKPANIKLRTDGTVKVLDFGIAKATGAKDADPSASFLPTETFDGTERGLILGTSRYMSPEQARGQAVDKRTDIWSFGCVLFEVLTGVPAFPGQTTADAIAAVLHEEPLWARLPAETSPSIRRLLHRCLTKDVRQRLRDIGDARLELEDAPASVTRFESANAGAMRRRAWPLLVASGIATAATAAALWLLSTPQEVVSPVTRTTVALPGNQELFRGGVPMALSPDGRSLVYVAESEGRRQLYLRRLDAFDAKVLEGTDGALYPFFSPDARSVAFFAGGKLKRLSLDGGAPVPICDTPAGTAGSARGRGGTWSPDGTIIFDPGESGLMRVSAEGGSPELVKSQDPSMDARNVSWPWFLPNGRALLASVDGIPAAGQQSIVVLSLDTGQWQVLGRGEEPRYLRSGHVVFHADHVQEGELQSVPFDATRLTVMGTSVSVLDGIFRGADSGGLYYAVSHNGALVFAPGGLAHTLVRVDRNGRRTPLSSDRRGFRFPKVSPDGRQIAVTIDPRPSEVWVYDIVRQTRILISTEGHSLAAAWTPDGRRVAYSTGGDVNWRPADASGPAELLLGSEQGTYPGGWTRDSRVLVLHKTERGGSNDIRIMSTPGKSEPLIATAASELGERLSPDDRWIAYSSDESGRSEVYVRPFPNVNSGKWAISTGGGDSPVWSPNGREMFYMNGATLMSVPFDVKGSVFSPGTAAPLFAGPFDTTQDHNYDVFPDGEHFVMIEVDPDTRPTRLQFVQNWAEELRRAP